MRATLRVSEKCPFLSAVSVTACSDAGDGTAVKRPAAGSFCSANLYAQAHGTGALATDDPGLRQRGVDVDRGEGHLAPLLSPGALREHAF